MIALPRFGCALMIVMNLSSLSICLGFVGKGKLLQTTSCPNLHTVDKSIHMTSSDSCDDKDDSSVNRRYVSNTLLSSVIAAAGLVLPPQSVLAADNTKPQEFTNVGSQAPPPNPETSPFIKLENGVQIKDYKVGTGSNDAVKVGSRVDIQCSGRLLNLNGVIFYNTKNNNPDGFGAIPLTFTIGNGEALPGLESGIIGMKKGGIRRIIIPPDLAYSKFPDLEPKPMNVEDQRALDSVIKNPRRDATISFDVKVERFK